MSIADAEFRDLMKLIVNDTMGIVVKAQIPFERATGPDGAAAALDVARDYTEKTTKAKFQARCIVLVAETQTALDQLTQRLLTH